MTLHGSEKSCLLGGDLQENQGESCITAAESPGIDLFFITTIDGKNPANQLIW